MPSRRFHLVHQIAGLAFDGRISVAGQRKSDIS